MALTLAVAPAIVKLPGIAIAAHARGRDGTKRRVTILTTLALAVVTVLAGPGSSAAQAQQRERGLGAVLNTLSGILSGVGRLHGNVVLNKGTSLVVRADDGGTYAIDTTQVDARLRAVPQPGDGVTVALAQGGNRPSSTSNAAAVATQIQLDPQTAGTRKTFRTVQGSIEQAGPSQVTFRTRDGLDLPIDVTSIVGLPPLKANESATLYYQQGQQGQAQIIGVWLEPGMQPSASTGTSQPAVASGTSQPSASISENAGVDRPERLHGLVESIGVKSFTLAADDGRKVTVQTRQLDPSALGEVHPGDLVTVSGRVGGADTLIAESVQLDASPRPADGKFRRAVPGRTLRRSACDRAWQCPRPLAPVEAAEGS